jgi:hypothetical protein
VRHATNPRRPSIRRTFARQRGRCGAAPHCGWLQFFEHERVIVDNLRGNLERASPDDHTNSQRRGDDCASHPFREPFGDVIPGHAITVDWQQSGSNLTGKITFTDPPATLNVNGTVQGSAINFATVGVPTITFSGTVSRNSMSGTYQEAASTGGNWSASKTS